MKYNLIFTDVSGKEILSYETDTEPPHIGELFQPFEIKNEKDTNTYRVTNIYYVPESQTKTRVFIEIVIA